MLQLTAPYGWQGIGVWISLYLEGSPTDEQIDAVLAKYGCCHPFIKAKIIASLRGCGRYDCIVQSSWFNRQKRDCRDDFKAIGVRLEIRAERKEQFGEMIYYG